MFYAREKELKELSGFLDNDKSKAMLLFGKRRVGKTELLKTALSASCERYALTEVWKQTSESSAC